MVVGGCAAADRAEIDTTHTLARGGGGPWRKAMLPAGFRPAFGRCLFCNHVNIELPWLVLLVSEICNDCKFQKGFFIRVQSKLSARERERYSLSCVCVRGLAGPRIVPVFLPVETMGRACPARRQTGQPARASCACGLVMYTIYLILFIAFFHCSAGMFQFFL